MPTYTDAMFMRSDDQSLLAYIESNYDQAQLRQLIVDTQQYRIKSIIGSGLYDELSDQITNNTLTSLNTTLLSYIRPAFRYFVLTEGVEIFTYKIRNKGVMTLSSDNGQPVSLDVLDRLMRFFEDRAQEYAKRCERYLLQNINSFPLYAIPGNGVDTIFPRSQVYQTGWYLGRQGTINDELWQRFHFGSDATPH